MVHEEFYAMYELMVEKYYEKYVIYELDHYNLQSTVQNTSYVVHNNC